VAWHVVGDVDGRFWVTWHVVGVADDRGGQQEEEWGGKGGAWSVRVITTKGRVDLPVGCFLRMWGGGMKEDRRFSDLMLKRLNSV